MSLNFQDQYGHQALDAKQHYDHFTGNSIVSGVEPSSGSTGLEVDIASGTAIVNGSTTSVGSQTVTLNAADSTNPRKDVITIDSTGSATVYTGTAESRKPEQNASKFELQRPAPDDLNGVNEAVVAEIFVAEGATTLASDDVRDRRNIASAVAGSLDMYGDIDMGSNSITSVNQIDGVDITNHSSRHESGGSDEITFGSLSNIEITQILVDTAANRPTAGTSGRVFFETDTGRTLYDNGTSWLETGLSENQISLANLGSNSHSELADAPSSAHHPKTTSASDLTDVSADSVTDAHHTKTSSASELSDVSADSVADAHHSQVHDLAGSDHNSATLSSLNGKISDATLDDSSSSRPPETHGNGSHSSTFSIAQNGGQNIWVQSSSPTAQTGGDLWFDTS